VEQRLQGIILPATEAQQGYYRELGLRLRKLTPAVMMTVVITLIWRQIGAGPTVLSRRKSLALWFGSWSFSGERRPGSEATPWPSHFLHSHRAGESNGTAIGSHNAARRCGPASLESAVSQVAALLWYPCFVHDIAPLLHDCGLSSTIRVRISSTGTWLSLALRTCIKRSNC